MEKISLPKEVRYSFFETREQYEVFRKSWASEKHHSALQHLMYAIMRGVDWRHGFAQITNKNKVENGGLYNTGLHHSVEYISLLTNRLMVDNVQIWDHKDYDPEAETHRRYNPYDAFGGTVNPQNFRKAYVYFNKSYDQPHRIVQEATESEDAA